MLDCIEDLADFVNLSIIRACLAKGVELPLIYIAARQLNQATMHQGVLHDHFGVPQRVKFPVR